MAMSFDFRFVVATREQFEEAVKQIGEGRKGVKETGDGKSNEKKE